LARFPMSRWYDSRRTSECTVSLLTFLEGATIAVSAHSVGHRERGHASKIAETRKGGISMKQCPYCNETIQDDVEKCRYCGEWLKREKKLPISAMDLRFPNMQAIIQRDLVEEVGTEYGVDMP